MSVYELQGRKALVTGGARGLGQGMAEALARAGAAVMIGDLLDEEGAETAKLIGKTGATTGYTHLDVTDEASWEQAVTATVDELGGLDILINNAGLEISSLVVDIDPADPNIVFPGIAGYSGTKAAVDRMTRIAAAESGKLGYGVRVNCVYPGLVPTAMGMQLATYSVEMGLFPSVESCVEAVVALTPSARLGEVADMADAVVFLASDAARFVNGTGLAVDGGMGS
jgi:3alpha(or 20beta)-hydroxysteroid dehydrogenase